jgi:hypothetical protein
MPEPLVYFLTMAPTLALFIGYLYAADALDRVVRSRYPDVWNRIAGHWDAHSSSNAFLLFRESELLRSLGDAEIARLLTVIRYIFLAFALSLVVVFLFG